MLPSNFFLLLFEHSARAATLKCSSSKILPPLPQSLVLLSPYRSPSDVFPKFDDEEPAASFLYLAVSQRSPLCSSRLVGVKFSFQVKLRQRAGPPTTVHQQTIIIGSTCSFRSFP